MLWLLEVSHWEKSNLLTKKDYTGTNEKREKIWKSNSILKLYKYVELIFMIQAQSKAKFERKILVAKFKRLIFAANFST